MPRPRRTQRQIRLQELLKAARLAAGLKQEDVARLLRRPQPFVSYYESGERRLNVIEFLDVCAVVEVDPRNVIDELAAIEDT